MDKAPSDKKSPFYIQLVGDIDDELVKKAIEEIDIANAKDYVDQICMTLVTYGGDILYAIALYEHIKSSHKPVDIVTEGLCMSAGVMLLQAARVRAARPKTLFMVHPSITSLEEQSYPELMSIVDQARRNHDLFVELSIARSGITREEFEKIYTPRKYLTAEEAKAFGKYGLIDEIWGYS